MNVHSIRFKLTMMMSALIAGLMLILCILNVTLLERMYLSAKRNTMLTGYERINYIVSEYTEGNISESDMINRLEHVTTGNAMAVIVVGSDWKTIYTNNKGEGLLVDRLKRSIFNYDIHTGGSKEEAEILLETDDFMLQQIYDERMLDDYYELWGVLDNGCSIMMRVGIQSIKDNIGIFNRFITYGGIIIMLIGILCAFGFSRFLSQPITQLSVLARRMSHLDFQAKYTGNDSGEVGVLGTSMNDMSEKLESTISQLKNANIELQRDIAKKDELENMRSEFLSNVSHELKTPIALIQGYAEGLKEGITDDPESMEAYLDVIIDEAAKMNTMVKRLLTLNQLEFGREELVVERFNAIEMLRNVVSANELRATAAGITMELTGDAENIDVWADEYRMEEVLTNYITNAINHCSERKLIRISYGYVAGNLRVYVYNSGNNIPEESKELIWTKFYKVDKARTREYGGNGIGLSIVKAIMDAHNMGYGFNNLEDGVEFWFDLDAKA